MAVANATAMSRPLGALSAIANVAVPPSTVPGASRTLIVGIGSSSMIVATPSPSVTSGPLIATWNVSVSSSSLSPATAIVTCWLWLPPSRALGNEIAPEASA